jgi:OOP family OmpA-OmpF porin
MTYLVSRVVDPDQVVAFGYGKEQPIADNNSAAGRSQNQRVEFKVLSTGTEEKSDEIEEK